MRLQKKREHLPYASYASRCTRGEVAKTQLFEKITTTVSADFFDKKMQMFCTNPSHIRSNSSQNLAKIPNRKPCLERDLCRTFQLLGYLCAITPNPLYEA